MPITPSKKIRGKILEIDAPTSAEREWLFTALQDPKVYLMFGCKSPPEQSLFDDDRLEIWEDERFWEAAVRYHILRNIAAARPVGFFIDYGWSYPNDLTRELDLTFPNPEDRNIGAYFDAQVIVAQYLFGNGMAKRLRWRIDVKGDREPRRAAHIGAHLIHKQPSRHPITGKPVTRYLYEYSIADFETIGRFCGEDPRRDYADLASDVFDRYRAIKSEKR